MVSIYNGRILTPGYLIPGTALTFIQSISKRRAEFRCGCGKYKVYWLSDIERGRRLSCGCGYHRKLYFQDGYVKENGKHIPFMRHVSTLGSYPYPRMSCAVDLDSIDISRELELLGLTKKEENNVRIRSI